MGRSPCCSKEGQNRGAWTATEDNLLSSYVKAYGEGKWRSLPNRAGLKRCGKSCRLRWLNYLRPDIKRGNITDDEEELIIRLHKLLGNRWSLIAGRLPGRTDNEIKNYWNTTLAKKAKQPSSPASEEEQVQHPWSTTSRATEHVTQPQVIQTKATRCRNVLILPPPPPPSLSPSPSPLLNQNSNIQFHHDDDGQYQYGTSQYLTNESQGEHAPTPKPQVNYDEGHRQNQNWVEGNGGDFCRGLFNPEMIGSSSMVLEGHGELVVNGWATSAINATQEDQNVTMDLDSLALFLDYGDWPLL